MSKPLASQPKYADIIARIDEHYKIMRSMRPLPAAGIKRYLEDFGISASHNSNAIEGNTFTYDETRLLLKEGITSSARSYKEHTEIMGYKKAFDFLYGALRTETQVSEEFIKQLHRLILPEEEHAGAYRDIQVFVGDEFNVAYRPVPPAEVPGRMKIYTQKLREDLQKNRETKFSADPDWLGLFRDLALHHIEYEKIHPFIDGNGRTGRLLLIYELISVGLLPVDIRYEERARYYAALKRFDSKKAYSTRPESAAEPMAKLLAESELRSMLIWNETFALYAK